MSVLIERINGKVDKGQPPADVYNVNISSQMTTVTIKWNDPNDTIIGGESLATWKGTILVRKYGSAPTSVNDGTQLVNNTVRNRYSSSGFTDNNLQEGTKIYYRFFTYSTKNLYNNSSNMIYNTSVTTLDPVLKNNSWEQIANASESGNIPSTWNIGDEIDITLSGKYNETVTLQIWDFDHFDKTDGTGKANICFGMKNLMKTEQNMRSSNTNSGGWNATNMRNTVMNNIFNSMPVELRNVIKEVNTYANQGDYATSPGQGLLSTDKVFLPGLTECCSDWSSQNQTETGQKKFPIFSNNSSRIKEMNNGVGEANEWFTRSPYNMRTESFCTFLGDGSLSYSAGYSTCGVCFCFNI